jgi:FkbM family methyltransferase
MSCKYFILTKPCDKEVDNDEHNQIICLNSKSYILPNSNVNYYISNGLFEKNLISWVKMLCSKDKNMLDIGAHSGTYTISLAEHCKHVYAFEPQKMTFYSLCGSVALSNITNATCINFGLGSQEQSGTNVLNIISNDGGGSTLHKNSSDVLKTEEIEIKTLDSFNIDNIGFIKIDVEDNELQVLEYAQNTLKNSNYPKILFEMNNYNEKLVDFLKGLTYNIIKIQNTRNMYLATVS